MVNSKTDIIPLVMDKELAEAYNATRLPSLHKSFCYAPSANMYFSQNGDVKVCCHNTEFTIGSYPKQSILEIWNSEKAKELRNYMHKYDLSHGCSICEFDLKLNSFSEVRAKHFDSFSRDLRYPVMMEFLLSNVCNLECVMCKGEYSSLIRKNREKLPPIESPYNENFIKQLEEFIPHLQEARFSGSGEAFSIDMNYDIWDMIIRLNPKCKIMIQTNGTILTDRVKSMLQRGNFQIGVSVDSLNKETFKAIRLNANFEKVIENARWFSEYSKAKKRYFMLAFCVMRQNWMELPAFITWCNELGAAAVLHKVWHPQKYALDNLPVEELLSIYNYLSAFHPMEENDLQKQNKRHYQYFVSVVKNWAENRPQPHEDLAILNTLSIDELFLYLKNTMEEYLDNHDVTDATRIFANKDFFNKLHELLALYPDVYTREQVLRQACTAPIKLILQSFEKYSVNYLFEEARSIIQAEEA